LIRFRQAAQLIHDITVYILASSSTYPHHGFIQKW